MASKNEQNEKQNISEKNKKLVKYLFNEGNKGNFEPFINTFAEDFTHTLIGTTPVSGTYRSVKEYFEKFTAPLMASFKSIPSFVIENIIAEDDFVVVVAHGEGGVSKNGKAYNNTYCHVMRMKNAKIVEVTEYLDTALVHQAEIGTFGIE